MEFKNENTTGRGFKGKIYPLSFVGCGLLFVWIETGYERGDFVSNALSV